MDEKSFTLTLKPIKFFEVNVSSIFLIQSIYFEKNALAEYTNTKLGYAQKNKHSTLS